MNVQRKLFPFLLLATILLFTACGSDDDKILSDYLKVEDAKFISTGLPIGSADIISNYNITMLENGRTAILSFYSLQDLKSVNIAIKGMTGHYQSDFMTEEKRIRSIDTNPNYYHVTININEATNISELIFEFSGVTTDGATTKKYTLGPLTTPEAEKK